MIYITGDCHQNFERFDIRNFPEQKEMTKDDCVIICGDFGGVWNKGKESKEEAWLLNWLDKKPFTVLFVDGNHENFDRLYNYPEEEWNGGKVHRIRRNVLHMMRGQIFEIEGKRFFTFGGAKSHDITDGILEPDAPDFKRKKSKMNRDGCLYRINHVSWWKEELASEQEMEEGRKNLERCGYRVDFIVTHCCATSTQTLLGDGLFQPDSQTDYLEEIRRNTAFTKWFFGHYHDNRNVSDKEILLYEQIIRIA